MRAPLWTVALAIPVITAGAIAFGPSVIGDVAPAQPPTVVAVQPAAPTAELVPAASVSHTGVKAQKACHSAYAVQAHDVPEHTVKATPKHSGYVVYAHTVPAHEVKANC